MFDLEFIKLKENEVFGTPTSFLKHSNLKHVDELIQIGLNKKMKLTWK